ESKPMTTCFDESSLRRSAMAVLASSLLGPQLLGGRADRRDKDRLRPVPGAHGDGSAAVGKPTGRIQRERVTMRHAPHDPQRMTRTETTASPVVSVNSTFLAIAPKRAVLGHVGD